MFENNEKKSKAISRLLSAIKVLVFLIIIFVIFSSLLKEEEETEKKAELTLENLGNAEYCSSLYDEEIQLKDGEHNGTLEEPPVLAGISDTIAFGDLNGDGKEDAAVIFYSSGGGSGTFYELIVMINKNGSPYCADAKELGDRVIIKSITIESGIITVNMAIHGPNDPMCCPTVQKIVKYQLSGDQLLEVSAVGDKETKKCDFSKPVDLRETTKYGIFGDDEFDTIVCGYLVTKEEIVWDEKQTNAYFVIIDFYDEKLKESIKKGIQEGNTINSETNGIYEFNLGCFENGEIVGTEYNESEIYLDGAAQEKILNSSLDDPASIILSFGKHSGTECYCCNLAHKIRIYE